jgi:hypothetical protein
MNAPLMTVVTLFFSAFLLSAQTFHVLYNFTGLARQVGATRRVLISTQTGERGRPGCGSTRPASNVFPAHSRRGVANNTRDACAPPFHPRNDNEHVKAKIRQQLQELRDRNLLLHIGRNCWRLP